MQFLLLYYIFSHRLDFSFLISLINELIHELKLKALTFEPGNHMICISTITNSTNNENSEKYIFYILALLKTNISHLIQICIGGISLCFFFLN